MRYNSRGITILDTRMYVMYGTLGRVTLTAYHCNVRLRANILQSCNKQSIVVMIALACYKQSSFRGIYHLPAVFPWSLSRLTVC